MPHPDPKESRVERALVALSALLLVASSAAAQSGARGERSKPAPAPETLADVRALFARVDADGNGKLSLVEADHGGIDGVEHPRFDHDGDKGLSIDEFVVARRLVLARSERPVAADLEAESTRVQALRRVRRNKGTGPSRRVDEALERQARGTGAGTTPPGTSAAKQEQRKGTLPAPAPSAGGTARVAPGTEPREPVDSGPGLARLRRAASQAGPLPSLEDDAREAQRLLELRVGTRTAAGVRSQGPASRTKASSGPPRAQGAQVPAGKKARLKPTPKPERAAPRPPAPGQGRTQPAPQPKARPASEVQGSKPKPGSSSKAPSSRPGGRPPGERP